MRWAEIFGFPLGPGVRPRRWMSVEEEPIGMEGIGVWHGRHCIRLILACHKSTRPVTGSRLLLSVSKIRRHAAGVPQFSRSLKVV